MSENGRSRGGLHIYIYIFSGFFQMPITWLLNHETCWYNGDQNGM